MKRAQGESVAVVDKAKLKQAKAAFTAAALSAFCVLEIMLTALFALGAGHVKEKAGFRCEDCAWSACEITRSER